MYDKIIEWFKYYNIKNYKMFLIPEIKDFYDHMILYDIINIEKNIEKIKNSNYYNFLGLFFFLMIIYIRIIIL